MNAKDVTAIDERGDRMVKVVLAITWICYVFVVDVVNDVHIDDVTKRDFNKT
jgi:hypothetical protein